MRATTIITTLLLLFSISCTNDTARYDAGVSRELAVWRKATIENLRYNIDIDVVENIGKVDILFSVASRDEVVIDYRATENIIAVEREGKAIKHTIKNEHIIIPRSEIAEGENAISIRFKVDNQSLNRNDEFLYTLLVPDRARTLFPCFEQPDMKASYSLSLRIPEEWVAVSNTVARSESVDPTTATKRVEFTATEPLSTYLFSFVAGKLQHKSYDDGVHRFNAYYRETDPKRLEQLDTIFAEVKASLEWLEEYTGIKYPFAKYDLIILPGFQYGGMEHTGATLYNDSQMFLSPSPTIDERLRRSQLIAHETAHMWFGDYVTMCWFDDVWTKEVFANYFAARMVEPLYEDINHSLNRLKSYTTAALNEDRTLGATSIRQKLDNLRNAGLIYGQTIYNKAPIVMDKLVELMGEEAFQQGIREYLTTYAYGNATWPELIAILDSYTEEDLALFSDVWVHQKGMPHINFGVENGELIITQDDPLGRGILWTQSFSCRVLYDNGTKEDIEVTMRDKVQRYQLQEGVVAVLPNSCGRGYGLFVPDTESLGWIMKNIASLEDDLVRESLLITLNECYENEIIASKEYLDFIIDYIAIEPNELIVSTLNSYLAGVMIKVGDKGAERRVLKLIETHSNPTLCRRLTMTLAHAMRDSVTIEQIYTTWEQMSGTQLTEQDYMSLSYELAIRRPELQESICATQLSRISNPDRRAQYEYISRATVADPVQRAELFAWLLKEPRNRRPEPWASSMLGLLSHHTRQEEALSYIYKGLDALADIQRTGDIFFPRNWVGALLGGHHSAEAKAEVMRFLEDNPNYSPLLRNKILQAAD